MLPPIKLIDFQRVRPRVTRYEHWHLRPNDKRACALILAKHGYRISAMKIDTGAILE